MRLTMKIGVGLVLVAGVATSANAVTLDHVKVEQKSELTRVMFAFSRAPDVKQFVLGSPPRAIIDMPETRSNWSPDKSVSGPRIKAIRTARHQDGTLRAVLDLRSGAYWGGLEEAGKNRLVAKIRGGSSPDSSSGASSQSQKRSTADKATSNSQSSQTAAYHVAPDNASAVVVIDPGHGGRDPGTTGPNGLTEKAAMLAVSRRVKKKLDARPGIKAVLTRHRDRYVSLPKRRKIAQAKHADLFVSLHANSYPKSPAVKGGTCYVLSRHGASNAKARQLARFENSSDPKVAGVDFAANNKTLNRVLTDLFQNDSINAADNLAKAIITQFGKVEPLYHSEPKRANFAVLRDPMIPSVLCETAFLSNPGQARKLRHNAFRAKLSSAIAKGVENYFERYPPMQKSRQSGDIYLVQAGDTLGGIAARNQTSVKRLQQLNRLESSQVNVGQKLRLPNAGSSTSTSHVSSAGAKTKYKVQKGDTLSAVARSHNVDMDKIIAMNELSSRQLRAGQELALPASAGKKKVVVNRGDTLSEIARRNGTSIKRLKRDNDLHNERLSKGQVLWVPETPTRSS
ncbi:LysM peptidoglycan-binding domain-containing protein [Salinisphaera sp. USBA-960]|uniref:N-acetylmuramoyl-L-alanine amidase n=1 Tax=Salinisphaera orenii TaxID=856731 RepID=UPI000DBE2155|nr:LysM peptidoglycan-binding domain-containing protein [Salifodinibacter halophilus]NNC25428.1 LysM peptidoglycan-binding domain-containing protein [Salifodinibacter halophilus]